ncbi:HAD family hydrolase [Ornithinimicrobium sp. F0845]|uniref:HAD family hydrolase n=1 Tax=Ornithinimicrobium sp. F0845 TaxID=2926412 RepID=UPI001FF65628|nr:HAD-IA family hydrolase [Ornithinimicrobium sp. F0845]MCK0111315.1 HAD family hydrolase [Ornithinimicrobium sp. F0845]
MAGAAVAAGPAPITAVLFDLHQTLVHGGDAAAWLAAGWSRTGRAGTPVTALGEAGAAAVTDFLDRIWEHARPIDPDSTRDESQARHREVFRGTVKLCPGIDPPLAEALYEVMPDRWEAFEDSVPVLTALRERGVRTAVISNIGFDPRPLLHRTGIVTDAVVLSYEVGSVKPAASIFNQALDLLGADPEESLMVGDSWLDDAGAAALGIRTLLLPRTDGPVHGLELVLRLVG